VGKEHYGLPKDLEVIEAKKLFEWWLGGEAVGDRVIRSRTGREFISLVMGKALQSQRELNQLFDLMWCQSLDLF